MPLINKFAYTSPGPRSHNQDSILVEILPSADLLCGVADGVGGNLGGETASQLALDIIAAALRTDSSISLLEAITRADKAIKDAALKDGELTGMASTVTVTKLIGNQLLGANCGDSRTYLLRGSGVKQLSYDHSEVTRLLREGKLTKETAVDYPRKNILDSALGAHKPLQVHEFEYNLLVGDRIVLLSDGVSSVVSKKDFRDLSVKYNSLNDYGASVIELVESRDTRDNYSLIIFEI
ncbi:PP2C family protein-serine/threonine phosphatase [Raoultella terrigena]|uniref:PP2C family protein-serine/threonine phosphatase n=1 Tax=Raoultella terrigena TaxID=577 RepID=UPI00097628B8|nr:protein phosphatase 2C domain-containing protein [Raoultella terrigena]OMP92216.1 hypothetical protein BZP36_18940 [Raoultella terrigena]